MHLDIDIIHTQDVLVTDEGGLGGQAWFMEGKEGKDFKPNSLYQIMRRLGYFPTMRSSRAGMANSARRRGRALPAPLPFSVSTPCLLTASERGPLHACLRRPRPRLRWLVGFPLGFRAQVLAATPSKRRR